MNDGTDGFVMRDGTPLLSLLEERMSREVLRYAVGHSMFCPLCDVLLDARRAVLYSPHDAQDPTFVLCGACSDARRASLSSVEAASLLVRYDLTDGRS